MSSKTRAICDKIVELLSAATFSVPIVAVMDLEPSYDVVRLDGQVQVIVSPFNRERDPVAGGLTLVEHKVNLVILAAMKPKTNYSTQDLEGLQEELEEWADECDLDRPEALTAIDVIAIYLPENPSRKTCFFPAFN